MTAFSFTLIPRYNDGQLQKFNAKKLGTIDVDLAKEIQVFISDKSNLRALSRSEAKVVIAAFKVICGE
ncbi:MAG TPA: hypothetical protein VMF58_15070 [Rhizomicrobium sp.]|nr:hypothetical protein [Rhizomicrobium sp.]